jgi:tetratricopeptide (TPR) repeat protein
LVAVAPFLPDSPAKLLQKDPGREFQRQLATELRADRRLRVVELAEPVSMGPPPDRQLETGFADAQRLLEQSGADLLIWGTQDTGGLHPEWDIYVSAGDQIKNQMRSEGFFLNGTASFLGIQEADTAGVLGWAVESWRGLIDRSYGMDIAPKIKVMIEKTDQALSLAYEKQWSEATRDQMKQYLSVLLCLYAVKTHDPQTLDRAVSLTSQFVQEPPSGENTSDWACFENNLGTLLQSRGMKAQSSDDLRAAVKAYRAALSAMRRMDSGANGDDVELNLAECLEILGRREGKSDHTLESVSLYHEVLARTSKIGELHQWMDIQTGLAGDYVDLGLRDTHFKYLRLAVQHYQQVLGVEGIEGMPLKEVQVETNLGDVYSALGGREQSVKDYEKALQYLEAAIPQLQGMSSTRNQAIALLNKGTCLMNLGRLENQEPLWAQAKETYAQAASLFALTQDRMEWASIQRDSGNLQMFMSEKKMDVPGLLLCLGFYDQEKTVHQKAEMPLLWAQTSVMESLTLGLLGDATGDPLYWTGEKKRLEEIGQLLDPKEQIFTLYEKNACLGSLQVMEGIRSRDPVELGEAVTVFEDSLKQLEGTDMEAQSCSLQSGLCQALAELLSLAPGAETERKGRELLQNLDRDYEKASSRVDRYVRIANRDQLEAQLALRARDLAAGQKARDLFAKAAGEISKEGYAYYGAKKEMVLGDLDLALAQGTGEGRWAQKAVGNYSRAGEILGPQGDYWKNLLKDKLHTARSFQPAP